MIWMMMTVLCWPTADTVAEEKMMKGTTPTRCMDESGQGPKRAIAMAIAHLLKV
jgi:hypothetical protein